MDTAESTDSSSSEGSSQSSDSFDSGPSIESQGSPDASQGNGQSGEGGNVPRGTNGNGEQKQESRYERTKRERKEFQAQKAQFDAERQQFAQERAQAEQQRQQQSQKPKRDYSLTQLKKYRDEWADEGKDELVARADQEIKVMEEEERAGKQTLELPRAGTPEHAQQWQAMETQLKADDPDFLKAGTRLDQEIRKLLAGPNADAYRSHPQGIYAAYSEAKKIVLMEENKKLRSDLQKAHEELKRYTGLTSIGAGIPGRMGSEGQKEFKNLSSAEMRKRLLADKRPGMSSWL